MKHGYVKVVAIFAAIFSLCIFLGAETNTTISYIDGWETSSTINFDHSIKLKNTHKQKVLGDFTYANNAQANLSCSWAACLSFDLGNYSELVGQYNGNINIDYLSTNRGTLFVNKEQFIYQLPEQSTSVAYLFEPGETYVIDFFAYNTSSVQDVPTNSITIKINSAFNLINQNHISLK